MQSPVMERNTKKMFLIFRYLNKFLEIGSLMIPYSQNTPKSPEDKKFIVSKALGVKHKKYLNINLMERREKKRSLLERERERKRAESSTPSGMLDIDGIVFIPGLCPL